MITPFWNTTTSLYSNQSWLPDGNLSKRNSDSWASFSSSSSNQTEIWAINDTPPINKNSLKTLKIRIYPTSDQSIILKKFFGAARFTYNQSLNLFRDNLARTKEALRAKCINSEALTDSSMKWLSEIPYSIRDEAMNDLYIAYTTGLKLVKEEKLKTETEISSGIPPTSQKKDIYREPIE